MNELAPLAGLIIASSLGSVGLWTLLGKWLERKGQERDGELGRARTDLAAEKTAHHDCLVRLDAVEKRLEVVEAHHASLIARWIKDAGKRICWVNGCAMATIFGPLGYTRDQVEGRTFQDLLDVEAAREIDRLDHAALSQPGMAVSTMLQLHHSLPLMVIVKVAGIGRDQELIYEGHAYRPNNPYSDADLAERRTEEQLGLSVLRLTAPAPGAG